MFGAPFRIKLRVLILLTELFEAGFEISNAVQVSPTIELQACN
jgi:hypothetical protein